MDSRDQLSTSGVRKVAGSGDLIADIHRQQRRKVFRRAAQLTALAVAFLVIAVAVKLIADSRARVRALEIARGHVTRATLVDLREAVTELEASLGADPGHDNTLAALALVRAQQWIEFGEDEQAARDAAESVEDLDLVDAALAQSMMALGDADYEAARAALTRARELGAADALIPSHVAWVAGMLALPSGDEAELSAAIADLERSDANPSDMVGYRRLRALLLLRTGDGVAALDELERAREQGRTHMGLAADEALYHAILRQELSGVADVADQLLEGEAALGRRDRAHALLARGVVHVYTGEIKTGIEKIDEAWQALQKWDRPAIELALQTALEAGDSERSKQWIEEAALPKTDQAIYAAWGLLAQGDIMGSLAALAELPQEHPRVGYLQALALVEQLRFAEALPWIERTEKLMPGRVELEVARARVELRTGDDPAAALGKLTALAEEEPYAPRAWTGVGEAHLAQMAADVDLRAARKAFERAIEREPVPAEAMLRLAEVWNRRRTTESKAEREALELLERAAKTNPEFPRYRQALAHQLADLGRRDRAIELMEALIDEETVTPDTIVRLARLTIERGWSGDTPPKELEEWLDKAAEAGAPPADVERERARIELTSDDKDALAKARERLKGLIEANPADVESRALYASVAGQLLDRDDAELTIRRGLQATKNVEQGPLYLAWARLASRSGKRQRAASHARLGWKRLREADAPAVALLEAADLAAGLWIRHQKPKVALSIARELTDRLEFHSDAWTIRADAELRANKSAEARQSAERALDLDDSNPRAHELHGHTLLRFGYKDRAREAYERAIELSKGTSDEARYKENLARL